jgi:hypothetical protein
MIKMSATTRKPFFALLPFLTQRYNPTAGCGVVSLYDRFSFIEAGFGEFTLIRYTSHHTFR